MNRFDILSNIIQNRRSIKPATMNGERIDNRLIQDLLHLADCAPTHAHTEPWRFIVYEGKAVQRFCADHANLYKQTVDPSAFITATYDKLLHNGDKASHLIAVCMKRGSNPKIPSVEEVAAVAAAVEHILLGAEALGIAALWCTGGLTHHPPLKAYFNLEAADEVIGLLYLGYAAGSSRHGTRIIPLAEKIKWVSE